MSTTSTAAVSPAARSGTIYNQAFWLAYAANVSLVMANALTFRFAEFVAFLGGTEQIAGSVVSAGVAGALIARLVLGQAIDRYGTRTLWMIASLLFVCGCSMFLASREVSWLMYAARIAFATGLAGMFTCSIVYVQNLVPAHRRTEVIASLGSSGFVGIITGTQLGDWIFRAFAADGPRFVFLFGGPAALGLLYFALVVYLTRNHVHQRPHETPAAHRLIFRYWPGPVVLAAVMMGISFTVTTVFLTRFATHLNLTGVGTFFTSYSISAFVFRIASRRWSQSVGEHRVILMGLAGHALGNGMLPFVTTEWHFLIPAVACGFGHALLFPVVISTGSGAFPREYRGTGTTIVLGFTEVGAMLSAPLLGAMIDHFGFPPMFYTTTATAVLIGAVYAVTAGHRRDVDSGSDEETDISTVRLAEEPTEAEHAEQEPVTVPYPHLGRSA